MANTVVELSDLGSRNVNKVIASLRRGDVATADPVVAAALDAVTELLDDNRALHDALAAQVDKVRRSRLRLVEAADFERRRLARRLAESAGKHLDELGATLGVLTGMAVNGSAAILARTVEELAATRDDLDQLAQGLHPRLLVEEGLRASLTDLARRAAVPTEVHAPDSRFPQTVETTIWYVCAEAAANVAKHAFARSMRIEVVSEGGALVATVEDDGIGGAHAGLGSGLAGLSDRVDAVGGHMEVASAPPDRHPPARVGTGDMKRGSRQLVVLRHVLWPAGALVVALSVRMVGRSPYTTYGALGPWWRWSEATAAAVLIVAGIVALGGHRRVGIAAATAGVLWLTPEWGGAATGGDWVHIAGDASTGLLLAAAVVTAAIGSGLGPVVTRASIRAVVGGAAAFAVANSVLLDPFDDSRCWRRCGHSSLAIDGASSLGRVVERAGVAVLVAATIVVLAATARRSWRRRTRLTSAGTMLATTALLLGLAVPAVLRLFVVEDPHGRPFAVAFFAAAVGAAGVGIGLAVDRWREWRIGAALFGLVEDVRAAPPGSLEAALRRAVGDPSLRLLYWSATLDGYVDATGRPVALPTGNAETVTAVVRRGLPVAALVHGTAIDGGRIERVIPPAVRLSLENEQLRAATLAELAELKASRARIVERADAERRRLERNLHDGAQQRVVGMALLLRTVRARIVDVSGAPSGALLARAEELLTATLDDLRRVAVGIHPAVLADGGLRAAVPDLAESSTDLAVRIDALPHGRQPAGVESAAYSRGGRSCRRHAAPGGDDAVGVGPGPRRQVGRRADRRRPARRRGAHSVRARRSGRGARRPARRRSRRHVRDSCPPGAPVRVVIADDSMLVRSGVAAVLADAGVETVGEAEDGDGLLALVATVAPDVAIVDIRMPPTNTDEGIVAARTIREQFPGVAVLVLSQHLESSYAMRLLEENPSSVGYLLKDRVTDVATLTDGLRRLVAGECVVDPMIVSRLLSRARPQSPLDDLTQREREVLALMAEGRSNRAICVLLFLSPKTLETHVGRIFTKLGLHDSPDGHRRVLAVLAYLRR